MPSGSFSTFCSVGRVSLHFQYLPILGVFADVGLSTPWPTRLARLQTFVKSGAAFRKWRTTMIFACTSIIDTHVQFSCRWFSQATKLVPTHPRSSGCSLCSMVLPPSPSVSHLALSGGTRGDRFWQWRPARLREEALKPCDANVWHWSEGPMAMNSQEFIWSEVYFASLANFKTLDHWRLLLGISLGHFVNTLFI